jgi:hypothetical protein
MAAMLGVTIASAAHIQLTADTSRRLRATQYSRRERCASTTSRKIRGSTGTGLGDRGE